MKATIFLFLSAVALGRSLKLNAAGCPIDPEINVLFAHEDCHKFYQCISGDLIVRDCPPNLVFNVEQELCDWPDNVNCDRTVVPPGGGNSDENNNSSNESCDEENESVENGGNSNPGEATAICAAEGSDGKLVAHENCNQFYKCLEGVPVTLSCPLNLLYNPEKEYCDWPENVNCDRSVVQPENPGDGDNESGGDEGGDNNGGGGGGNNNPGEAAAICAAEGSDGKLVAHENCNQFYKCLEGVPVALSCPLNLLYNAEKEYCDWPENVNCDRSVVQPENPGDGDNESGGDEGGDNNGGGGGGNNNPGDAAAICAAEGSDGKLIAHENCNQFYKCLEGVPVALSCPLNLLYNAEKEYCDWPENVNCDRSVVQPENPGDGDNESGGNEGGDNNEGGSGGNNNPGEAAAICAAEGSDGKLIAHENCNQFYKCLEGVPVALSCPLNLLYNAEKEYCDWPENVNCDRSVGQPESPDVDGDSDSNSGGDGNSDPSEVIAICAAEGSEGVLVAHENCAQFYKCSKGKPVTISCPNGLLYNAAVEQCDWAENVVCK